MVSDNGIGFDQKYAERIFVIFQRLNEKKGIGGNGLGLAMGKRIAEAHGGLIFANSEVNVGTKFSVILPFPAKQ